MPEHQPSCGASTHVRLHALRYKYNNMRPCALLGAHEHAVQGRTAAFKPHGRKVAVLAIFVSRLNDQQFWRPKHATWWRRSLLVPTGQRHAATCARCCAFVAVQLLQVCARSSDHTSALINSRGMPPRVPAAKQTQQHAAASASFRRQQATVLVDVQRVLQPSAV